MTTVLFIHGTGVREREFAATYARIKTGLAAERPDIGVERCFWGEIGAELQADGLSFYFDPAANGKPAKQDAGQAEDDPVPREEKELARWARLIDDPLFEIRLRRIAPASRGSLQGRKLRERVRELPDNPELAAGLEAYGLTDVFAGAVAWLTQSNEFMSVLGNSAIQDGVTEQMLSRALVASCLATLAEDGIDLAGDRRDRLVSEVQQAFGVKDYAGLDNIGDVAKNVAFRAFERPLQRSRRAAIKQLADIVLYQAHGAAIRGFVRDRIRKLPGPVVLLAHSLGGIIAFDLLTKHRTDGLDQVRMLVTVGSQVPLLYELGALSCGINYPKALPEGFRARWVNVYDRRDLLAYAGGALFGDRCLDMAVDTKTPFPTAHGAYWDEKSGLYRLLAEALRLEEL